MAKTESTLINMVLALLIITSIAGASLGMVYKVTKEPIAMAKLAKQQNAIKEVVPGFDNNPTDDMYQLTSKEGYILQVFPCKKGDELLGVAISSKTDKGFSGEIKIMVGLKPDGTIINYAVLEHKETPGLGTKMDDWFRGDNPSQSIVNRDPANTRMSVSKDGGDIDAITAATISSRAFLDAIMIAYDTYKEKADAQSAVPTLQKGDQS
ncbi:RnfABCDGE type electron transport complex subunit G [Saccharicrinis carchari]|nr:RnfABCDGE type electron transport complex subunit G [Saccharicrinis carchari]